eukprot:m.94870 g.94870  ORF g.94870 m.94870 type:complete len:306 (+) comp14742_c1_seq3:357-1274(+)
MANMSNKKVLIGGGSGLVGRAISSALNAKGYQVVLISRTSKGPNSLTWTQIEEQGLPPCHAVINLAGASLFELAKRWIPNVKQTIYDSRIGTTSLLAKAIANAPARPKVFITASGVGYYEAYPTKEESPEVDESSPNGQGFLCELARDWEGAAQPAIKDGKVRHVAMRMGAVLSSEGGAVAQAKFPFLLGLGGRFGSGQQLFPWIHIRDAANLYVHAIENDSITGPVNAVAPQVITNSEYTQAFARAVHRFAIFPMPSFIMRLVFGADVAHLMLTGQRVVPKKALDSGFNFAFTDIDAALQDILQ